MINNEHFTHNPFLRPMTLIHKPTHITHTVKMVNTSVSKLTPILILIPHADNTINTNTSMQMPDTDASINIDTSVRKLTPLMIFIS